MGQEVEVTAEAALDLAEALGTTPELWMGLQTTFDLARARRRRKQRKRRKRMG